MCLGLKKKKKKWAIEWENEWKTYSESDGGVVKTARLLSVTVLSSLLCSHTVVKSYWQMNLEWDEGWYSAFVSFELEGCAVIISEDKLKCIVSKHILNKLGALVLS